MYRRLWPTSLFLLPLVQTGVTLGKRKIVEVTGKVASCRGHRKVVPERTGRRGSRGRRVKTEEDRGPVEKGGEIGEVVWGNRG